MSLHVHCHISGGHFLLDLFARLRYYIFCKELPVVIKLNSYSNFAPRLIWSKVQVRDKWYIIRCWRLLCMEMGTWSKTTQTCRMLRFGCISTPTFLNSTRWSAGAHSGRPPPPATKKKMILIFLNLIQHWSHVKRAALVAFHQWAWFLGLIVILLQTELTIMPLQKVLRMVLLLLRNELWQKIIVLLRGSRMLCRHKCVYPR